jgi:inorganic triphosphatase YgiF
VPPIGFEKTTKIVEEHKRLPEEHNITILEGEQPDSPYEVEYKLLYSGDPDGRQSLFDAAEQIIRKTGLTIDSRKSQVQNDTYMDDDDFTILFGGGSFRVRQTAETATITLKAKPPDAARPDGEHNRLQEEQTITVQEANAFLAGNRIEASPVRLLRERFPNCGSLAPRVKVETTRETLHARNKNGQDAEVCFDFVRFLDLSGKEIGRDVEIEIESKGMPVVQIAKLADLLRKELALEPSPRSKYGRAFDRFPGLLEVTR